MKKQLLDLVAEIMRAALEVSNDKYWIDVIYLAGLNQLSIEEYRLKTKKSHKLIDKVIDLDKVTIQELSCCLAEINKLKGE